MNFTACKQHNKQKSANSLWIPPLPPFADPSAATCLPGTSFHWQVRRVGRCVAEGGRGQVRPEEPRGAWTGFFFGSGHARYIVCGQGQGLFLESPPFLLQWARGRNDVSVEERCLWRGLRAGGCTEPPHYLDSSRQRPALLNGSWSY